MCRGLSLLSYIRMKWITTKRPKSPVWRRSLIATTLTRRTTIIITNQWRPHAFDDDFTDFGRIVHQKRRHAIRTCRVYPSVRQIVAYGPFASQSETFFWTKLPVNSSKSCEEGRRFTGLLIILVESIDISLRCLAPSFKKTIVAAIRRRRWPSRNSLKFNSLF